MKILEYGYADVYKSTYLAATNYKGFSKKLILSQGTKSNSHILVAQVNKDVFIPLQNTELIEKAINLDADTKMSFITKMALNKPFDNLALSSVTTFRGEKYVKGFAPLSNKDLSSEEVLFEIAKFEEMLISNNLLKEASSGFSPR